MRAAAFVILCGSLGCTPTPPPSPRIIPEAGDADPCAIESKISQDRLIRNPDGTALVIHCDGSTVQVTP